MGMMPAAPTPPLAPEPQAAAPPAVAVMDERTIIEQYGSQLEALIRQHVLPAIDGSKVALYRDIRRNAQILNGRQHLVLGADSRGYLDLLPMDDELRFSTRGGESDYDYDPGIYEGDVRKLKAVLGQRGPNIHCTALYTDNEDLIKLSKVGQHVAEILHYSWQADKLTREGIGLFATDGPVFWHTPFVTDKKYGTSQEPKYKWETQKMGPDTYQCPECGQQGLAMEAADGMCPGPGCMSPVDFTSAPELELPVEDGYEEYTNGMVECHLYSGLYVTTPMNLRRFDDTPFVMLQRGVSPALLLSAIPELEGKFSTTAPGTGMGDDTGGAETRRDVAAYSQASQPQAEWMESQIWLEYCMYHLVEDKELRAILKTQYPDGIKTTWVNKKLCRLRPESLFDVWTAAQPEDSSLFWTQPYLNNTVEFHMLVADLWTFLMEQAERSSPLTLIDEKLVSTKEIENRRGIVGGMMNFRAGGGNAKDRFIKLDAAEINPQFGSLIQTAGDFRRDNNGLQQAIYGAEGKTKTALEAEQLRNQALLSLNPLWRNLSGGIGGGWARATRNGVMQLAKHSLGVVYLAHTKDKIELGDLSPLLDGGLKWEPEESMPQTASQLKAFLLELSQSNNPEVPQKLGLFWPANLKAFDRVFNVPGWTMPQVAQRDKIMQVINRLAMEQPIIGMPQLDPMTGQMMPGIPQPSVPPDPAMFDAFVAVDVCREWLWGDEGAAAEETPGYENVRLYTQAWWAIANPPMLPPPGGGGGGAPGEPGPEATAPDAPVIDDASFQEQPVTIQ